MMKSAGCAALAGVIAALAALPAAAQFEITSKDGKSSLKLGLLAQPQAEWVDSADGEGATQNLFLRRLRILMGGRIGEKLSFFVETDSPNLGKADATGKKNADSVFIQDVIVTYTFSHGLMIDSGLLLTPNSHNSAQGATTLLPIDYGPYSFLHSAPTGSRVGRDYGVQARGYLVSDHLEYRLGVFQGAREEGSRNAFRTVGRVVWYPFEAETGFFYTGTSFGRKRILAVGASYDRQDDYEAPALDVYFDWPVGRNAVTAQVDLIRYDGGDFLTSLPEQDTVHLEAGFFFSALKLEPFVNLNDRDYADAARADEKLSQVGLAYWHSSHTFNVKLGYGRLEQAHARDQAQIVLQAQLFFY
jgi:hypothetical protein